MNVTFLLNKQQSCGFAKPCLKVFGEKKKFNGYKKNDRYIE